MARPVKWEGEVKTKAIEHILFEVSNGRSVRSILDKADREDLPSWVTFAEWLKEDEGLAKQYAYACEARADAIFEDMLEISDNTKKDIIVLEDGREIVDHNVIGRDKLRVETRKWMLGKMNPKKYGDKIQQEVSGSLGVTVIKVIDEGEV